MRKVAFFDVDGTIFRSSLLIELVEILISDGYIPEEAKYLYEMEMRKWLDREDAYEAYIEKVIAVFMKYIKGIEYVAFENAVGKIVSINKKRVYTYTRDLVAKLRKEKYFLVAVSQSPKGVLDAFCREMGFNKIYGRFYELGPQDRFTGALLDEHVILNKSNIVKRVLQKEKLSLKGSVAVGDTEGDIPMLELVETPICFNPNAKLFKHAKRMGWKVVIERKDVVYEILP